MIQKTCFDLRHKGHYHPTRNKLLHLFQYENAHYNKRHRQRKAQKLPNSFLRNQQRGAKYSFHDACQEYLVEVIHRGK